MLFRSAQAGDPPALLRWLEGWRAAGGDRRTLRLMVATLISQGETDEAGLDQAT